MSEVKQKIHEIRIVFSDDLMNGVTTIGGAGWLTQEEQEAAWAAIPDLGEGSSSAFLADFIDENGDIVKDKRISAETCEALMGKPISVLIEEGRENTIYTLGEMRSKHPEMFSHAD